jgi:antitoxin component of MazEF toxin-antitoxin module
MPHDYEVTLKSGALTLPDAMLKETNLKEGDEVEISVISANRFLLVRAASHRDLFKPTAQVTRGSVEAYLTQHGYHASDTNPDIWEAAVKRTTKQGKALGKVYNVTVNVTDLIADPDKFAAFVRRHP